MFEESLVESTPLLRSQNRWPALASIGFQLVLAAILVALPLLYPDALTLGPAQLTSLIAPPPRPVPPPPPPVPVVAMERSASPAASSTLARQLPAPSIATDAPPVADALLPVGVSGLPTANPLAALTTGSPASPHVTVAQPAGTPGPRATPNISGGVIAGLLIAPIRPVYPTIARMTHMEGVVIVQAIISKTGRIESAHVLSGPAMLQQAALDAVREARYRPYLLSGEPTEVETTITINFRMGN